MRFLNTDSNTLAELMRKWYSHGKPDQHGNNRTGQRLGQYVYNNSQTDGPWPELFYERNPEAAAAMIYAEME